MAHDMNTVSQQGNREPSRYCAMKKVSNKTKAKASSQKYITRNKAVRKLQLRLSQFRRLCILKGIYPRDPKKKPKGAGKTYYHYKDILFLAHEPLLKKFREITAHERKVRRANAKLNAPLAQKLLERKPTYRLDHLVKERYPSFIDALRDLDDALTLVHLFATLPAESRRDIPRAAVQASRRLALEWQAYVVKTASLRKVFIAVKGFYYQADVLGQTVTWLVPHQLSQVLPNEVDFRILVTFCEFYQTLLQFVNFKLYHMVGASYPPVIDARLEEAAAGIAAIMHDLADPAALQPAPAAAGADEPLDAVATERLAGLQDKLQLLRQEAAAGTLTAVAASTGVKDASPGPGSSGDEPGGIDSGSSGSEDDAHAAEDAPAAAEPERGVAVENAQPAGGVIVSPADQSLVGGATDGEDDPSVCATLFRGLVFFLGREVPREQLLVVIRAFGGQVGWEGEESPLAEDDPKITHQVFDRPTLREGRSGREYVQPQWVVDSANFRVLVDARLYAPGVAPPPHLSPFADDTDEGYEPEYAGVLRKLQESARAIRQRALGLATEAEFMSTQEPTAADEQQDAAAAEHRYTAELEREAQGDAGEGAEATAADRQASGRQQEAEALPSEQELRGDEEAMNAALMKRKDRVLYKNILKRKDAQRKAVDKLKQKRAKLTQAEAD